MHVNHAGDFPSSAGKSAIERGRGKGRERERESARLHNQLLIAFKMSQRWNTCNLARTVSKLMGARRRRPLTRPGRVGKGVGGVWLASDCHCLASFHFFSDEISPSRPHPLAMITSLSRLFVNTHTSIKDPKLILFSFSTGATFLLLRGGGMSAWDVAVARHLGRGGRWDMAKRWTVVGGVKSVELAKFPLFFFYIEADHQQQPAASPPSAFPDVFHTAVRHLTSPK